MSREVPDANRLDLLLEVARRGSIAGAAEAAGVTPSAVSQQMSLLEREVGLSLLDRGPRGVTLTGAGTRLAERAQALRRLLEETQTTIDQLRGTLSGRVRAASIASAAMTIVLPAVERLHVLAPRIDVTLSVLEPATSVDRVVDGSIDVAVIDIYDHVPLLFPEHLEATEIYCEPLVLVTPDDTTSSKKVTLHDLQEAAWVMPPADAACGQAVRYACRAAGFEPRIRWETDDLRLLVEAVAHRQGVAVLPRLAVEGTTAPVKVLELARPSLKRRIFTVTGASTAGRPVVRTVLDQLQHQPA